VRPVGVMTVVAIAAAMPSVAHGTVWAQDLFVGAEVSWHFTEEAKLGCALFARELWSMTSCQTRWSGCDQAAHESVFQQSMGGVFGPRLALGYRRKRVTLDLSAVGGGAYAAYSEWLFHPSLYRPYVHALVSGGYRLELGSWRHGPTLGAALGGATGFDNSRPRRLPNGHFAELGGALWWPERDQPVAPSLHLSWQFTLIWGGHY